MHKWIYTYKHTHIIQTYTPKCKHACLQTCIQTYARTCIKTYIYLLHYIHTATYIVYKPYISYELFTSITYSPTHHCILLQICTTLWYIHTHTLINTKTCVITYNHTCISTTCVVSAPAGCLWCGTPGLSLNAPCAGVAVVPPSSSNRDGRNDSVPLTKSSCKTLHRPPFMRTSKRSVCPPATPSLPYLGMQQNPIAAANVGVCWLPSSLRGADSKSQSSEDHTCFDLHQCYWWYECQELVGNTRWSMKWKC